MSTSQPQIDSDAAGLLKSMIDGYRFSQTIHVVAKLHVAELLAAVPMTVDELAGATRALGVATTDTSGTREFWHFLRGSRWQLSTQPIDHASPGGSARFTMGFCTGGLQPPRSSTRVRD